MSCKKTIEKSMFVMLDYFIQWDVSTQSAVGFVRFHCTFFITLFGPQSSYKNFQSHRNLKENKFIFSSVITVPADGLAPIGDQQVQC